MYASIACFRICSCSTSLPESALHPRPDRARSGSVGLYTKNRLSMPASDSTLDSRRSQRPDRRPAQLTNGQQLGPQSCVQRRLLNSSSKSANRVVRVSEHGTRAFSDRQVRPLELLGVATTRLAREEARRLPSVRCCSSARAARRLPVVASSSAHCVAAAPELVVLDGVQTRAITGAARRRSRFPSAAAPSSDAACSRLGTAGIHTASQAPRKRLSMRAPRPTSPSLQVQPRASVDKHTGITRAALVLLLLPGPAQHILRAYTCAPGHAACCQPLHCINAPRCCATRCFWSCQLARRCAARPHQ